MRNEVDYYAYLYWYLNNMIVVHKEPYHVFDSIRGNKFTIKETSAT